MQMGFVANFMVHVAGMQPKAMQTKVMDLGSPQTQLAGLSFANSNHRYVWVATPQPKLYQQSTTEAPDQNISSLHYRPFPDYHPSQNNVLWVRLSLK
jgi:hypothetical protein